MGVKIKTAFRYWGIVPSTCFCLVILSQLMIIVGTIGALLK